MLDSGLKEGQAGKIETLEKERDRDTQRERERERERETETERERERERETETETEMKRRGEIAQTDYFMLKVLFNLKNWR